MFRKLVWLSFVLSTTLQMHIHAQQKTDDPVVQLWDEEVTCALKSIDGYEFIQPLQSTLDLRVLKVLDINNFSLPTTNVYYLDEVYTLPPKKYDGNLFTSTAHSANVRCYYKIDLFNTKKPQNISINDSRAFFSVGIKTCFSKPSLVIVDKDNIKAISFKEALLRIIQNEKPEDHSSLYYGTSSFDFDFNLLDSIEEWFGIDPISHTIWILTLKLNPTYNKYDLEKTDSHHLRVRAIKLNKKCFDSLYTVAELKPSLSTDIFEFEEDHIKRELLELIERAAASERHPLSYNKGAVSANNYWQEWHL